MDENGNELADYYIPNPNRENFLFDRGRYNPFAWSELVSTIVNYNDFNSSVHAIYEIIEGLRFTSRIAVGFYNYDDVVFVPAEATNRDWNDDDVNVLEVEHLIKSLKAE